MSSTYKKKNPYEDLAGTYGYITPKSGVIPTGSTVKSAVSTSAAYSAPSGVSPASMAVSGGNAHVVKLSGVINPEGVSETGGAVPVPTAYVEGDGGTGAEKKVTGNIGGSYSEITSESDFYKSVYDKWDEYYNRREAEAKADLTKTTEQIDKDYNAAVAESQAAYQRALATYGSNADSLQRMGLTGSGYSDYIGGKAYETQRAESVAAGQARDSAMLTAQQAYRNAINTAEDTVFAEKYNILQNQFAEYKNDKINKGTLFNNILSYAHGGDASAADLRAMARESGVDFDESSWAVIDAAVSSAADKIMTEREREFTAALLSSDFIENLDPVEDAGKISALAEAYGIDKSRDFWKRIQKSLGFIDTTADTGSTDTGSSESGGSSAAAKTYTDEELKTTQARGANDSENTQTESALRINAMAKKTQIKPNEDGYNYAAKMAEKGSTSGIYTDWITSYADGSDFDLYVNGKKYALEMNWTVNDQNTINTLNKIAGGSPAQGQAVVSCGDLFVYGEGKWHSTSSRYFGRVSEYEKAVNAYKDFFTGSSSDANGGELTGGDSITSTGAIAPPEDNTDLSAFQALLDNGDLKGLKINGNSYTLPVNGKEYTLTVGSIGQIFLNAYNTSYESGNLGQAEKNFISDHYSDLFLGKLDKDSLWSMVNDMIAQNIITVATDEYGNPKPDKNGAPTYSVSEFGKSILDALSDNKLIGDYDFKDLASLYFDMGGTPLKDDASNAPQDNAPSTNVKPDSSNFSTMTDAEKNASLKVTQNRGAWDNDAAARNSVERLVYAKQSGQLESNSVGWSESAGYSKGWTATGLNNFTDGEDFELTINGETYKLEVGYQLYDDIEGASEAKAALNQIATGSESGKPKNGQVVMSCGDLYIYSTDKGWCTVSNEFWSWGRDYYTEAVEAYKSADPKLSDDDFVSIEMGTRDYGWSSNIEGDKLSLKINNLSYKLTLGDTAEKDIATALDEKYYAEKGKVVSVGQRLYAYDGNAWRKVNNSENAAKQYLEANKNKTTSGVTGSNLTGTAHTATVNNKYNGYKLENLKSTAAGSKFGMYINGDKYNMTVVGKVVDKDATDKLTKDAGTPTNGTILTYDGKYMFVYSDDNGWCQVQAPKGAIEAYEAYSNNDLDTPQARGSDTGSLDDREERIETDGADVKEAVGGYKTSLTVSNADDSTGTTFTITFTTADNEIKKYTLKVGHEIDLKGLKGISPSKGAAVVIAGDLYVSDSKKWYAVNAQGGIFGSTSADYKKAVAEYLKIYNETGKIKAAAPITTASAYSSLQGDSEKKLTGNAYSNYKA